jgi:hypothetical protein
MSLLYHLPASAGAIIGCERAASVKNRPPKPRRLCLSLALADGLQLALEGKVGRDNSISVFYQN